MVILRRFAADEITNRKGLFELIDRVQAGVPYHDTSGTMVAADWGPKALAESEVILLAMNGADIVGYCLGQSYQSYGGFLSDASDYGVTPSRCFYLSEFGVDETCRQAGIGAQLIAALLTALGGVYDSILVRTMLRIHGSDKTNPAIAFYRKAGFELVQSDGQTLIEDTGRFADRPRVFLRWRKAS